MPEPRLKIITWVKKDEPRALQICMGCRRMKTRRRVVTVGNRPNPIPICKNCLPAYNRYACSKCGALNHNSAMTPFLAGPNKRLCVECAGPERHLCQLCGGAEGTLREPSALYACDSCMANRFTCSVCHSLRDTRYNRASRGPDICISCRESADELIKSSCFKGFAKPIGDGPLFFGVELETEVSDDREAMALLIQERVGEFCVMKNDGSLQNGIEIVSCPASFEAHKTLWDKLFFPPLRGLTSWRSGRCGIHIHMTKKAIKEKQFGRMLVLVNATRNAKLITTIAGRGAGGECGYARRHDKGIEDAKRRWEKYEALNNYNGITYELRIFRGTLTYKSFHKNIEFAHALTAFCADDELTQADCEKPDKFLAWLGEHTGAYPNLFNFLVRKGFIEKPKNIVEEPEEVEV